MKKLWFNILAFICAQLVAAPALSFDIYGRSDTDCNTVNTVTRCGHGPVHTLPYATNNLEALYVFDNAVDVNGAPFVSGTAYFPNLVTEGPNANNRLMVDTGDFGSNATDDVALGSETFFDPVDQANKTATYLDIRKPALVRTENKFNSGTCRANGEVTVELWLRNDTADILEFQRGPKKIVTLSGASNKTSFYLGQNYDGAAQYNAAVRDGARSTDTVDLRALDDDDSDDYEEEDSNIILTSLDTQNNHIFQANKVQHVVFTHQFAANNGTGTSRLYATTAVEEPQLWTPTIRNTVSTDNTDFSMWGEEGNPQDDDFYLSVGNEITAFNDAGYKRPFPGQTATTEDKDWRGQIYLMAVYCRGLSEEEVLGEASKNGIFQAERGQEGVIFTDAHFKAVSIYRSITGVTVPTSSIIIAGDVNVLDADEEFMAKHVANYYNGSDTDGLIKAAQMATFQDNFFNVTVRDMAKRMSNRAENVNVELNDFVTYLVGLTAGIDIDGNITGVSNAKELLVGNQYYSADPNKAAVPDDVQSDMLTSNNHYLAIENQNYNLVRIIKRNNQQKIFDGINVKNHPDPAGLLTTRAFMEAHAVAGTNRRMIEFVFREFMCLPMENWANASGPDDWIGADVSRFPGGDHKKFLQTCRGCHSSMDGFRGATAKFNFSDGFVKYAGDFTARLANDENDEDANSMYQDPIGVAGKLNRNPLYYPCPDDPQANGDGMCKVGREVTDDRWINYADLGLNKGRFGFRTPTEGRGMRQFGELIAESRQFSKCMTERVFRAVCKRDPQLEDANMITNMATAFEKPIGEGGFEYNLRDLFANVAVTRECRGNAL